MTGKIIGLMAVAIIGIFVTVYAVKTLALTITLSADRLCVGTYINPVGCSPVNTTTVNAPASGNYVVTGVTERGNSSESGKCQGNENFYLVINGQQTNVSYDPDPCETFDIPVYRTESFGTVSLQEGSNEVRMVHADRSDQSTAHSVSVELTLVGEIPGEPQCGDGTLDAGEQCDDGNTTNGDGCSAQCTIEQDEPQCGDGTLDAGEQCDDGNTTNGDGCSAQCKEEEEEEEEKECKGSIGNTVWLDQNGNGKEDAGEKGLSGVKVWLYHGNSVKKKTTDANGQYTFKKLCKGSYDVVVKNESVSGYTQTYDPDSKKDNKTDVKLTNDNDDHTKADFGYRGKVAPSTGSGSALIMIALALSALISFGAYTVLKKRIAILA
ncbi:MAG TPA: SdrD B-like domain-containing protein [Patescibacteria group bacterium]|nr:SdrD B-like domain-containing protein [Patescibacteria group bacterium]